MEEEIRSFVQYRSIHEEFLPRIPEFLGALENAVKSDQRAFKNVVLEKYDSSAILTACGRDIKLSFEINVSEDMGYINWYYIYLDEVTQERRGKFLFYHRFDYNGNVFEDPDHQTALYSGRSGFSKYLNKWLLIALKKIDSQKPLSSDNG